jgi:Arylsulfotransferase (ASST)
VSTGIEQAGPQRGGTGLRAYDPERAAHGYTLFAPLGGGTAVYLVDMQGRVTHTWDMPYTAGYAYLTERGTLVYCGKVAAADGSFLSRSPWKGGAVLEVDWDGTILWEVRHPDHHHDGRRLRNGNVLLLCLARIPEDLARRVSGGLAGSEDEGVMHADYLVEMTTAGHVVWKWRAWEHLDLSTDVIVNPQDSRSEWTHGNGVAELPDGNLVVSFRSISTVVIVDRGSGEIVWRLGPPTLANQHAPTPLPNGNLLIFDNGTHRLDGHLLYSRVLEIDPCTKQVVWRYQDRSPLNFYSPLISNAQRLWNGNTLINAGTFGRLFEVTTDGQVVWEYINPFFGGPPNAQRNWVFRAYRYTEEEIARARSSGHDTTRRGQKPRAE